MNFTPLSKDITFFKERYKEMSTETVSMLRDNTFIRWESQISWRKTRTYEHCAINTNKDANSIFTSDTMNELGTLMQYSYPLQKMFLADKSIASRTGHDKVWVQF